MNGVLPNTTVNHCCFEIKSRACMLCRCVMMAVIESAKSVRTEVGTGNVIPGSEIVLSNQDSTPRPKNVASSSVVIYGLDELR